MQVWFVQCPCIILIMKQCDIVLEYLFSNVPVLEKWQMSSAKRWN